MGYLEIVIIAIGLAMDAFAASISKGLCMNKFEKKYALLIAVFFGSFQFLMPVIGWILGSSFAKYIMFIDHWIAFILLSFIGGKMLIEAFEKQKIECCDVNLYNIKRILILAIATSIDALAVGITFALMPEIHILDSAIIIGVITFVISYFGVFIGYKFGTKFEKMAEIFGGLILIIIGIKILVEHLFF